MIYDILTTSGIPTIWLQQRQIFYGHNEQEFAAGSTVTVWTDLHGSSNSPIAKYTCASDNSVKIDLTDYIRTYPYVTDIYFGGSSFEQPSEISIYGIGGLIDPATMIIPRHKASDAGVYIVPPSVCLYNYEALSGLFVEAIFYPPAEEAGLWKTAPFTDWEEIGTKRIFVMDDTELGRGFRRTDTGEVFRFPCQDFDPCKRFAVVQWLSADGKNKKQHVFFVSEQVISDDNSYSLEKLDNELNAIKGREERLTLYIDNLDTYDIWYYSDILTSSSVVLKAVDGSRTNDADGIHVEVTTKNVTVPSGDKADGKMEFEIIVKRYDAVAM